LSDQAPEDDTNNTKRRRQEAQPVMALDALKITAPMAAPSIQSEAVSFEALGRLEKEDAQPTPTPTPTPTPRPTPTPAASGTTTTQPDR
jgi:hypothetical protein